MDVEEVNIDEQAEDNEATFTIFEQGEMDDDEEVRFFYTSCTDHLSFIAYAPIIMVYSYYVV